MQPVPWRRTAYRAVLVIQCIEENPVSARGTAHESTRVGRNLDSALAFWTSEARHWKAPRLVNTAALAMLGSLEAAPHKAGEEDFLRVSCTGASGIRNLSGLLRSQGRLLTLVLDPGGP